MKLFVPSQFRINPSATEHILRSLIVIVVEAVRNTSVRVTRAGRRRKHGEKDLKIMNHFTIKIPFYP